MSGYNREDVTFDSHGTTCAAWLYRPTVATSTGSASRPPVIVMAHGFAAIKVLRLDAYAERFAEAGYAVLVFDYRGWGDSAGRPRRVLDIRAQHQDWRAAVAFARRLEEVDTSRIVLWGTSFGGGHALHLAAEDHDVAAVVAQVPHISGPASAFSQPPKLVARLVAAGIRDQARAMVGREPYRVAAAGYPGDVAMMTSPDAAPMAIRLAGDHYEELLSENDVAARIALRVPFYSRAGQRPGSPHRPSSRSPSATPSRPTRSPSRRPSGSPGARSAPTTASTSSPTSTRTSTPSSVTS